MVMTRREAPGADFVGLGRGGGGGGEEEGDEAEEETAGVHG